MAKRSPLPSGYAGVYRADDGKRWEAYVADRGELILLGVYPTIRKAVAARINTGETTKQSLPAACVRPRDFRNARAGL
jgi:hypothetical protein